MNKIKVSACIITYNHEDFIRECLDGAINQKVNFEYEIVIGEDYSSDLTKQICIEYAEKYPNLIKFCPREKNLGMIGNWIETIQDCSGNYIAMCEGDDYWTDPLKLQKQVDFLEANPDYVLCFHKIDILKINGEIVDDFITEVPENYETIETLARLGNYIHTPSVVFRNIIKEFPFEFSQSPIGDYFLYMMLAEHGKLKYLEDKMAIYREGVGVWSDKTNYFRNFNTALVHTYLFDYFIGKENNSIPEIFLERIQHFIINFKNQISKDDLIKLSSNVLIRTSIFDLLLTNLEQLKKELIDKKKTGELLVFILERIKKRIWR